MDANKEKAIWFKNRYGTDGIVLVGMAKKKDILAYLIGVMKMKLLLIKCMKCLRNLFDLYSYIYYIFKIGIVYNNIN